MMVYTNAAARRRSKAQSDNALFRRAYQHYDGGNLRTARRLFLLGANRGDAGAQTMLGLIYDMGVGTSRNRTKALLWYRRAYKQGSRMGASNIGTVYRAEGNLQRALIWFRRAVRLRDGDANLEIARILLLQRKSKKEVVPYLKRVIRANKMDVTQDSREKARKLLRALMKD